MPAQNRSRLLYRVFSENAPLLDRHVSMTVHVIVPAYLDLNIDIDKFQLGSNCAESAEIEGHCAQAISPALDNPLVAPSTLYQ